uniref:leucine--tRNA ligase n=1 Tax=Amphimedon queenslandica TaxID=400682 RepID=A0A1X7TRI3_AMPQE
MYHPDLIIIYTYTASFTSIKWRWLVTYQKPKNLKTTYPKCGSVATRETDAIDTFVDSTWYFLRYINPMDANNIVNKDLASQWLPVYFYLGGIEHAVLHLLYSRFIMHFLYDIGVVPVKEPFEKLITQAQKDICS